MRGGFHPKVQRKNPKVQRKNQKVLRVIKSGTHIHPNYAIKFKPPGKLVRFEVSCFIITGVFEDKKQPVAC
jgi:hypothetical protein